MPFERHGQLIDSLKIDSADYRNYLEELRKIQVRQKLKIHVVLTPYSTNYGDKIPSEIPLMNQLFCVANNDSLIIHDLCYDEQDFERFIDLVHMSDIGARAFTTELAMELLQNTPMD